MAPSLRVAAQIGPYFVVGLDLGATKAFSLRLVWRNFRAQRCPLVYVDTPYRVALAMAADCRR
jgi:3'-phosphoadenosine 5'-phosphosulfate sulfotransferase (PAPS reductase)/FAD synthetase